MIGIRFSLQRKQSGIKTDRATLARCLASLEPGDVVLVTKLDRLARSTWDLLNTLATIGEAGRASSRWVILGPTPRPRTAG